MVITCHFLDFLLSKIGKWTCNFLVFLILKKSIIVIFLCSLIILKPILYLLEVL